MADSVFSLCRLSLLTVMGKHSYSKRVNRSRLHLFVTFLGDDRTFLFFFFISHVLAKKDPPEVHSPGTCCFWSPHVSSPRPTKHAAQRKGCWEPHLSVPGGDSNLSQTNSKAFLMTINAFFSKARSESGCPVL